jgi:hypothetical protein
LQRLFVAPTFHLTPLTLPPLYLTVSKRSHRLLSLTALVAVLWAQAFGMHIGYHCACDLEPSGGHFTFVDHCHGPQPTGPDEHHHDSDHSLPHDHDTPLPDGSHEHEPVVDTLVASSASFTKVQPPAPFVFLLDPLSIRIAHPISVSSDTAPLIASSTSRRCHLADNWPHQLSQSIALRL